MAPWVPESMAARFLRSNWFISSAVLVIVGLLVCASVSWSTNRFSLEVVSHTIDITVSERADHSLGLLLPPNVEVRVSGYDASGLPPELLGMNKPVGILRLSANKEVIDSILLDSNATLTVTITADGNPDLRLSGGGEIGITFQGTVSEIHEDGVPTEVAKASRPFRFSAKQGNSPEPVRIVLVGAAGVQGLGLFDQPVNQLRFSRPLPSTEDRRLPFQSEIISGTLQLLDSDSKTTLRPHELVWLDNVVATVARIEITDKGVALDVSGLARRIGLGPPRPDRTPQADRDLTPSVLEYLVGQHRLKLAWGAAIALLAALWKARQWAMKS
ncbi:hypothetical protein ACMDCR_28180 [Labrys okinawensis]|uniref:hypothetical protein n=1 Tax=Labrys okinawensis TaxID=346911 RepID=UPI0039BC9B3E